MKREAREIHKTLHWRGRWAICLVERLGVEKEAQIGGF